MYASLTPNMRYYLDTDNRALVDTFLNSKYVENDVPNVNTEFFGHKTNKPYEWYLEYYKLGIDLAFDFRSFVNDIEINKCGTSSSYMSSHVVQTKSPVCFTHEDRTYAVLFRFGDIAISKDGYVIDIHNKKITHVPNTKEVTNSKSYRYYYIRSIEYIVHRLIAEAWIYNDDPIRKTQINHKDGDKLNNYVDNLEWVTPSENINHLFSTGLSQQNIISRIRHRYTKEIKEFSSISEMCKFLNISQFNSSFFKNSNLGYLYNDYEVRVNGDNRDWYYLSGNEPVVPKEAIFKIDVYRNSVYDKTFFKTIDVNMYLGVPKKQALETTQHMLKVYNKPHRIEITKLAKTGPYYLKELATGNITKCDKISDIVSFLNYNETSIRYAIDTENSLLGFAIKTENSEWYENYTPIINNTASKKIKLVNKFTNEEKVIDSINAASAYLNTTKKTFRRYLENTGEYNGWLISVV